MPSNPVAPATAWGSRWTFALALAAVVLGAGNLWLVPSAVVAHGGGAFLMVYALALMFVGVPLVMTELAMARRYRHSPDRSLQAAAAASGLRSRSLPWAGRGMVLAAVLLFGLYSVLGGVSLAWLFRAALGELRGTSEASAAALFSSFASDAQQVALWQAVFIGLVMAVAVRNLGRGVQRSLRTVVPLLAGLLVIMTAVALSSGKAQEAAWSLFWPRWHDLGWYGAGRAVQLALYSLAIGVGVVMTLGSYMPGNASMPLSAIGVAVVDLLVTLVLGLAVTAFVLVEQVPLTSGFELVFVALPQVFEAMAGGQLIGSLFYLIMVLLVWTSALFTLEVVVTTVTERLGGYRPVAALVAMLPAGAAAVAALFGFTGQGAVDVWALMELSVMLVLVPISVLALARMAGWQLPPRQLLAFLGVTGQGYRLWRWLMAWLVPLGAVIAVGLTVLDYREDFCRLAGPELCGHGGLEQSVVPLQKEPYGVTLQ
ncbi:sodium-dependent transporter [Salicola sp. Rm-C-2C1-2]|uniref:sodium-dependent transporter n=1 Tax=Salicola sp. Rm-C-2C1-2 TaxID=3141321 RepID=UPI0032E3C079